MRAQGTAKEPSGDVKKYQVQDSAAEERERLILEHLPQVRLIARRIHERLPESVSLDDLISTGTLGLIAAIDRFDPRHNVKLKTYAEYKIRGAILDSLRGLDWAPRQQRKRSKQIEVAISAAEQRLHRGPTEEEIACELNLTLQEYHEWLVDIRGVNLGSLEAASPDDASRSLLKYISDDEENWPSRLLERSELQKLLADAIEKMPSTERTVISLYYHEELTLREISKVVNLHESRVSQLKSQAILRLPEEMARQLTGVMEAMMGEAPNVALAPHELSPEDLEAGENALLWWEQSFSVGSGELMWVGAKRQSWEEIGNRILKSAGVEDGDTESIRSTYLEIVNQALSGVASALSARAREDVACTDGHEAPPDATGGTSFSFEIGVGDQAFPAIVVFSKTLLDLPDSAAQADVPKRIDPPSRSAPGDSKKPTAIDLLLDVELPVSVSFGRAQLPLKDVIKLTTGSIVELNRAVSEPVDVIVNNCVIARGEVVVVEGNFGVRIRQVISRQERLRTLY